MCEYHHAHVLLRLAIHENINIGCDVYSIGSWGLLDVYESLPGFVWPSCNTHSQHMGRYMKEEREGERDGGRGGRQRETKRRK